MSKQISNKFKSRIEFSSITGPPGLRGHPGVQGPPGICSYCNDVQNYQVGYARPGGTNKGP